MISFSKLIELCICHHSLVLRYHLTKKHPHAHLPSIPSPFLAQGNHWSIFSLNRIVISYKRYDTMLTFTYGFFYLVQCFGGSSMLWHLGVAHSFLCWIVSHCMGIVHFAYVFSSWWVFGLFPVFGYEYLCVSLVGTNVFISLE